MLKHWSLLFSAVLMLALNASASPLPPYPFVHVVADAVVHQMPDIGTLDFEIVAADADPAVAHATIEASLAGIRALLTENAVALADLEVRDVRKELRKDAAIYDVRCSVHLNMRDLSRWRAVVGPLLDAPNLQAWASSFDVLDRERIEAELMGEALRKARRRAESIAKGARRKLGAVMAVTPAGVKNLGYAMGVLRADFLQPRARGADVTPGELLNIEAMKLMQPIDVVFRLE